MSIAKTIRIALVKRGMTIKDLALRIGCSPQNLSGKLRRDNFSESELHEIAKGLGCALEVHFIDNETGEIV